MSSNDMIGIWNYRGKWYVANISADIDSNNLSELKDAFLSEKRFNSRGLAWEHAITRANNTEYGVVVLQHAPQKRAELFTFLAWMHGATIGGAYDSWTEEERNRIIDCYLDP